MICADFLAGANLDNADPEVLLRSAVRFYSFLSSEYQHAFLAQVAEPTNHDKATVERSPCAARIRGLSSASQ
jgi:hypothetical protein